MVIIMWLLLELFLFQATLVRTSGIEASSSSAWYSTSECSHGSLTGAHTARSPLPLPSAAFARTSTTTSATTSTTPSQITESSVAPTLGGPSSPAYNPPDSETLQPEHSGNSGDFMTEILQPEDSGNSSDLMSCSYEHLYSCQVASPEGCRCDELCPRFGDCCFDSKHVPNRENNVPNFECVSNVLSERGDRPDEMQYFWMIASCPKDNTEVPNGLRDLCEVQSLPSPPISDNRTGLVYRNKHCSQCHGVPDREQMAWQSRWLCKNSLMNTFNSSGGRMDMEDFMAACNASVFKEPPDIAGKDRHYPLRKCDGNIIYKCRPPLEANTSSDEYHVLERLCRNESGKVKTISTAPGVYKNEYCALCSSPDMNRSSLKCPPVTYSDPPRYDYEPQPPTYIIILDVTLTGIVVLDMDNITITSTIEQSCPEGQVYDVYRKECRKSHCQHRFTYNGSDCLPVTSNIYPSNCTLIALNDSEYQVITSQIIYWFALEQNVSVQGYNTEGKPLICTNFTTIFTTSVNETVTRTLYGYPAEFTILTYLGLSMDTVAAAILLFTYAAFAKMRTFFGKLFMNFVLVLLLGDLTFLLGTALHAVTLENVVCQVVAILLHYLFLARFVWMSLLSLNVARHFYHAAKFIVSEDRENWRHLILYMAAGWLSPLLVLIVTVTLNYAISGTVGYGVDGLCWMNERLAIIVSFIVPLIICIIFTAGAFVFVCIILVKLHRSDNETKGLKHRSGSRNCRVLAAVFCITGSMWLFGFLALIDSALSWAWYIFIILNTTQAVFLTLAYVCTAKVLRLYRAALSKSFRRCARNAHGQPHIAQQTVELELSQAAAAKSAPS